MSSRSARRLHRVQIGNVLAMLMVDDFATALPWYERLFDRAPDRRPMSTCAEWQLTDGGSVQVFGWPRGACEVFTTPEGCSAWPRCRIPPATRSSWAGRSWADDASADGLEQLPRGL